MKTIMMAAAVSLMLAPAAKAAVPVAEDAVSTATGSGQVTGGGVEMAGGPGRSGPASARQGKGSPPGKSTFGANDSGKQDGEIVRIARGSNKPGSPSPGDRGQPKGKQTQHG